MPLWTPAFLGTGFLRPWLKADALALNDTDPVAPWTDLGPHGRSPTNGTAGERPLYRTNQINGLPAVVFDGTDDDLTITTLGVAKPLTIAFVAAVTGTPASGNRPVHVASAVVHLSGTPADDFVMSGGAVLTYKADGLDANAHVHVCSFAASGNSRGSFDGTAVVGNAGTTAAGTALVLGSQGSSNHVGLVLGEFVVINRALVDEDVLRLEGYLAHRWGVALAAGHAYEDAAPVVTFSGFAGAA